MKLIDLNHVTINNRAYGGASCGKIGIIYAGENYLVKFPGNLTIKQFKNVNTS